MSSNYSLRRSTPEEQGVSSEGILSFLEALKEYSIELHSFMMVRNNTVISEGWWAPHHKDLPHMLFSLSKSFTSTAIGFAVTEGLLNVENSVIGYCRPELTQGLDDKFHRLKIKHLLTMSTGQAQEPDVTKRPDGDWEKGFLEEPIIHEPGTQFHYNSMATYMLSVILTRVTGQTVRDYLMPRLFEPLGIENPVWDLCPRGYSIGGWGLNLITEDIAKFGLLYLNKGLYDGKQILSPTWIDEATSLKIANGDNSLSDWAQGYGYQFWRCRHNAYRGDGAFGQYCVVFPDKKAIIAITSAVPDMQSVLNLIYEHLLPAMAHENTLPSSPDYLKLQKVQKGLALDPPKSINRSDREPHLMGLGFTFTMHPMGIKSISFSFEGDTLTISLENDQSTSAFLSGREQWVYFTTPPLEFTGSTEKLFHAAGSFTWESENILVVTTRLFETPYIITDRYTFSPKGFTLLSCLNVSFEADPSFKAEGILV